MPRRRRTHGVALVNAFASFAKAMLVIAAVLVVTMAAKVVTEEGVKPKAEAMIRMSWPKEDDFDIDVWIRDPQGKTVYYGNKQANFLSLERDDLGMRNMPIVVNGITLPQPEHEEIVMIRGWIPGEYVMNVHFFSGPHGAMVETIKPFIVQFLITKLNPRVETAWMGAVTLDTVRQEKHVVRFTVDGQGNFTNIRSDLPTSLRNGAY